MVEPVTYQLMRSRLVLILGEILTVLRERHRGWNPCPQWMMVLRSWMDMADPRINWRENPERLLENLYGGLWDLKDPRLRESLRALRGSTEDWQDFTLDSDTE
jgi:hypothetical protein